MAMATATERAFIGFASLTTNEDRKDPNQHSVGSKMLVMSKYQRTTDSSPYYLVVWLLRVLLAEHHKKARQGSSRSMHLSSRRLSPQASYDLFQSVVFCLLQEHILRLM
jgi:hypothetical protein